MEQRANHSPQPACVIQPTPALDDLQAVLATDPHQAVRIDVRVGRDERAIESVWAGGLFEFHFGPRSVLSVEALSAGGARVLTR